MLVLPQLPIGEGGDHADRALGEVEDARGVVRHHQADGQEAVDRAEDDAEDGEREEDAHVRHHVPNRGNPNRGDPDRVTGVSP